MSDLEERLREAITASVASAEPSSNLMGAVRQRHRRWLMKVAGMSALAATAVFAAVVFLGVPQSGAGHSAPAGRPAGSKALVFAGGGRLLVADRAGLKWLYPDGRIARIAPGFAGATLTAGGLLAWKQAANGFDYYTMNLDGSHQRLALPAEGDKHFDDIQVQLSPNGSRLAYVRQQASSNGDVTYALWAADLATGQRVNLGPVSVSALAWRDDSTILAGAADAKALLLINVATRSRSTYLTVNDPLLVTAYERARPGAGRPAYIESHGWSSSGTSALLAVWLAAANPTASAAKFPQVTAFTKPAEFLLAGRSLLASYAPATPQQLNLTWGPNGLFLIQTGAGDNPGSWNTYAGTLQSGGLSRPMPYGMDGATYSPAGNVIALQDNGQMTLLPTPRPACNYAAECLNLQPSHLTAPGTLQAWAP